MADYHQFYNRARECDQCLSRTEDKLNTTYGKQSFSIGEGEQLLKGMSQMEDDITRYGQVVTDLVAQSEDFMPSKQ